MAASAWAVLALGLVLGACAHPRFPASSSVADQPVQTTVDSAAARAYLENHLAHGSARQYRDQITQALATADAQPLSGELLQRLTEDFSTDFATLYLIERLYRDERNRRLQQSFHAELARLRDAGGFVQAPPAYRRYLMVFVPGYAYALDRTTGADFGRQRDLLERAGFDTVLIETDELANVEPNAKIIAEQILRLSVQGRPIVLVSASKGGAEAALALGRELTPAQARSVRAWVSIGGLLRGSPYADWAWRGPKSLLSRIVFVFAGLKPGVIPNVSTRVRRPIFEALEFPEHMLMLQYVGAPLSGHIRKHVRGRYKVMKKIGPNDGLTLLLDEITDDGGVITSIGFDHYFSDPEIDLKTLALAMVVLRELNP